MSARPEDVLRELARLAADLGPALEPPGHAELLRSLTAAARGLFDAAACSIALVDEAGEELVFTAATGAGAEEVLGLRIPLGRGIAGWAVAAGQPIAIGDVARDPRFARDVAEATGYVPRSILAMPLEGQHETLGVMEVLDPGGGRGTGVEDLELLALLARQAALAVEQAQVFGDLGRALFRAAGLAADGSELRAALEQAARDAPRPEAELAELATHLRTLAQAGPAEQRAATRLLGTFAAYVRGRGWP